MININVDYNKELYCDLLFNQIKKLTLKNTKNKIRGGNNGYF
ncbi:MAG: hypothetical protein ACLFPJ_02075 [Candidatus Woesearchaeota archaeon]